MNIILILLEILHGYKLLERYIELLSLFILFTLSLIIISITENITPLFTEYYIVLNYNCIINFIGIIGEIITLNYCIKCYCLPLSFNYSTSY